MDAHQRRADREHIHHRFLKLALLAMAALGGCIPNYDTIDEACKDSVGGARVATDDAVDFVHRMNCYRRFVKLPKTRIEPMLQTPAEDHANYLDVNGPADPDWTTEETPGLPGYTGDDAWDRVSAQEYELTTHALWWGDLTYPEEWGSADMVDDWIANPYTRRGILQPMMDGVGLARQGPWTSILIGYSFPASERSLRPVIYPKDGQTNVPTELEGVGYPITITVGGERIVTPENWYDLSVSEMLLRNADGDVLDMALIRPEDNLGDGTLMFIPEEPLRPNMEHRFTATVDWDAIDNARDLEVTFTTGPE